MHSKFYMLAAGLVLLGCSGTATATAIGQLNTGICGGGGVTVSAAAVTWLPSTGTGTTGCIETGAGTSLTYSGGTLSSGVAGNIKNLPASPLPVDQFMTFATLDFVLAGLGPGSANIACSGLAVGSSCSVFAGSPFILTNTGNGNTSVTLDAFGTITDGGVTTNWHGSFTTQLTETADQIQTTILGGGSVTSTHSGSFAVTSAVPEPTTLSMLMLGGLALLGTKFRKLKTML